eukprot:CAMPEP_0113563546 /NCGR_PEP_ID=MMETSP0015_2-20120614/21129_1 /TAXON_ID=2838 /ORGANISM="Odontella" /LENGTH=728 /DNA_ID=CAMNT_0000465539 /DNA_START=150 /DNA_END=2336 /DNA_ORIENTATION=+ /assembly_acc=CAM_ASM_000160
MEEVIEAEDSTASLATWLLLFFIATLSFWTQAAVTEERFVPSLNVIANFFSIPDDVAGATLMAAGASSPELFSSVVALFVTHSALGLGTIVGSEIFNQLVICAGAVMAARRGTLTLDRAIVTREVGFYALSIGLLYNALKDRRYDPDDPPGSPARIYISVLDAALLFGAYVLYVVVCGNFDAIVGCFSRGGKEVKKEEERPIMPRGRSKRVPIQVDERMPFLQRTIKEPTENFQSSVLPPASQKDLLVEAEQGGTQQQSAVNLYGTLGSTRLDQVGAPGVGSETDNGGGTGSGGHNHVRFAENAAAGASDRGSDRSGAWSILGKFSDGLSIRLFTFLAESEKPSDQHDLYDLEVNAFEERLSCFLWQRSIFYNKAKVALHGWHLRWFNFTHDRMASVPDRRNFSEHQLRYPNFREMEVDEDRLIIRLKNPNPARRDYFLMAPSTQVFEEVVKKCEELMKVWEDMRESRRGVGSGGEESGEGGKTSSHSPASPDPVEIDAFQDDEGGEGEDGNANPEPSLIEFPSGEGYIAVVMHCILFPLKLLMHLTIPDVRNLSSEGDPRVSLTWSFVSVTSCLMWLIVGSYAMVASLEKIAFLMNIPDAVIGVTVSAAGTSLPNYVASQCAARQGFGNMAVSNAFGSNTFNILVGLGLPWVLYTTFVTKGEPYDGLRDDGIVASVIILASVLLAFVVLILWSDFILYRWHAPAFLGLYALYLAYSIGQVYIGGIGN